MAIPLRQSTEIKVRIGPFVDATDGVTPETGITLGAADQAEALKADGAATASIAAATWAAISGADGWYDLTLTTSHTDTVGELMIVVQDSSVCLPVFQRFVVIEENVYDMLYASGGDLGTTVDAIPTTAMRGTDSAALASVCTEARLATLTDWINGGRLDLLLDAIPTTLMRGTDSAALASVCTEVRLATLTDWINGGRLDLLLDAIPTTAMRGTDNAALASVCTESRLAELDAANLPADVAALNDVSVADIFTTQMTEAYAANGTAPTLAQSLFAIHQMLMEFAISGTSITVKKLDDTTAFTVTLDDATSPTSVARA